MVFSHKSPIFLFTLIFFLIIVNHLFEFNHVILLCICYFLWSPFVSFFSPFLISVGLIKFSLFHFFSSAGVKFIYFIAIFYSIFYIHIESYTCLTKSKVNQYVYTLPKEEIFTSFCCFPFPQILH